MTAWGCVTARPLFYAPIVVVYISKSLFYDMRRQTWFNGYICRCAALCGCIAACSAVFGTLYS